MNEIQAPTRRRLWRPSTFAGRLILPFNLVIGAIALFVFLFFPSAMEKRGRAALVSKGHSIADVATFSVEASVFFNDKTELENAVAGILRAEGVVRVEVWSETEGLLLAQNQTLEEFRESTESVESQEPQLIRIDENMWFRGDRIGTLSLFLSQENLLRDVARTRTAVGFVALLIFLAGVGALVALSRLVTRPLGRMAKAAEAIAAGNLSRRAPVHPGTEVGALAETFNEMVARLEDSQTQLQEVNQELELRVEERTRDLMESEAKLQQIQKMEAVGRLAGGVAHDFNNLLTVITGHVDLLLLERTEGDPDFSELEDMKTAADRAADLTRQLLAFGRRQVLRPRNIDPNQLVSDWVSMLSRVMGEHIRMETRCGEGVGEIVADPGQLERAILNMAMNAKDAMPKGGILTLETETIDHIRARLAYAAAIPPGRYAMVTIKDTGMGISRSDLPKVFEPFFSTKEFGDGSGLGLAMVDGIVNQSGGFIFVDSELGKGTEFRLFFPEAPVEGEAAVRATAVSDSALVPGHETILVVEDEDMVRKLTCSILKRAGYTVLSVAGSLEAIGVLKNHQGPIDLVLTDVIMPGMTGDQLAVQVQAICPDSAVLFMSGHSGSALEGVSKMDVDLLEKPFTADQLAKAVRSVLDQKRPGVAA